jgi:hypothetical protein
LEPGSAFFVAAAFLEPEAWAAAFLAGDAFLAVPAFLAGAFFFAVDLAACGAFLAGPEGGVSSGGVTRAS